MGFAPSLTGYFGKLPARGDFLRAGLPEDFVAPLDLWCREILTTTRAELDADWEEAWMSAPIWHFLLPANACGPRAVRGVWLPSMDKAGRHYPFILCVLAENIEALAEGGNWALAAEAAGLAGVVEDAPHEAIPAQLAAVQADAEAQQAGWWTEGSPLVEPCRLGLETLFPINRSGEMLRSKTMPELEIS